MERNVEGERAPASLIHIREVARRLGVSRSTIRRLVKDSEFPAPLNIGGSHRWRPSSVEAYLKRQERADSTLASSS